VQRGIIGSLKKERDQWASPKTRSIRSLAIWTGRSIRGAALLVIDHHRVVCRKCYGLADLETQRPIAADSSFYLGSISKQFTAMAIMLLAEQGRLSYEDRLPGYFPQFPSWGTEISVRHLLHHTSGLPEYVC
jgi:CubicO group peptidase (beta-lactamase class C family)